MPDVERVRASVVIPNRDGGALLEACLESLPRSPELEVLVVDNGSSDRSAQLAELAGARVLRLHSNHGFAEACNIGAASAQGEVLVFLNNDCRAPQDALELLISSVERGEGNVILQPLLITAEGEVDSAGDLFTWSGFFAHLTQVRPKGEVFSAKGACMALRGRTFTSLGGFHSDYFAYFEESDLCWRARLRGWSTGVVVDAHVEHVGGQTASRLLDPHQIRYLQYRNRWRSIWANCSLGTLARLAPAHAVCCVGAALVYAASGRARSAVAVLQASLWPLWHPKEMVSQRRDVQATRQVPDEVVLSRVVTARVRELISLELLTRHLTRW